MAGRPEEKYEPGELSRIKENLGKLSKKEALIRNYATNYKPKKVEHD